MLQDFQSNYPNAALFIVVVAFIGFLIFLAWARKYKFVPHAEYNPTDSHHIGAVIVMIGLCGLSFMIWMGYGGPVAQAFEEIVSSQEEAQE